MRGVDERGRSEGITKGWTRGYVERVDELRGCFIGC